MSAGSVLPIVSSAHYHAYLSFWHQFTSFCFLFFFFNDTATTEIYTLSLHDALPICLGAPHRLGAQRRQPLGGRGAGGDRKSTRLNSSHRCISYAVFCLKKKKKKKKK